MSRDHGAAGAAFSAGADPSVMYRKTKMCRFFALGQCERGARCTFAHDEVQIQNRPDLYRTKLCPDFAVGRCDNSQCRFAHGRNKLRRKIAQRQATQPPQPSLDVEDASPSTIRVEGAEGSMALEYNPLMNIFRCPPGWMPPGVQPWPASTMYSNVYKVPSQFEVNSWPCDESDIMSTCASMWGLQSDLGSTEPPESPRSMGQGGSQRSGSFFGSPAIPLVAASSASGARTLVPAEPNDHEALAHTTDEIVVRHTFYEVKGDSPKDTQSRPRGSSLPPRF